MVHRIPCCGFLFSEKEGQRKILKEKIDEYKVPNEEISKIQKGEDFETKEGNLIPNKELTADPAPVRQYAFCSDTAYNEALIDQVKGVDLLYHEATFDEESAVRANETYHSTAIQAATIAQKANVDKLVIGHFSAKYKDYTHLLDEARQKFKNSHLADEGVTFSVPVRDGR